MKIKIILFFLFFSLFVKSQILYNFTAIPPGVFTPNVSGTTIIGANSTNAMSGILSIGFTFQYNCQNVTQFRVCGSGWMTFNTGLTASATNNLNTSVSRPVIAPLWDAQKTDNSIGNVNYLLTGVVGSRILTIEWLNMRVGTLASAPVISYQVKLYETSNRIEFVYKQETNNFNGASASIGLSGPLSGDFYSVSSNTLTPTATKAVETTSIGAVSGRPQTGQIYRWDPYVCSGPPAAGSAVSSPSLFCTTYPSTLTLSGLTPSCGLTYQWQSSSAIGGPYTSIPNATNTIAYVTNTATTYYQCLVTCSGFTNTSAIATASFNTVTPCNICNLKQIPSVPYSQTAQTTCGNGDNVNSTNVVTCGSSFYYGGEDVVYSFTPTATGTYTVGLIGTQPYLNLTVFTGCPINTGTCIGGSQSSASTKSICLNAIAGVVYYIVLDIWPNPTCYNYDFSINGPGCGGTMSGITAAASPTSGCNPFFTTLSTNFSFTGCSGGVTYQWQSGPTAGGPFTSISSGTTQNYVASATGTTFFRCVLSCGTTTAASPVIQTVVTPTSPTVPCSLSTYTAATTTYNFETFGGTTLPTTDDVLFNSTIYFGFSFCFGGSMYWGGYVASNGAFVLDGVPCYPNVSPTFSTNVLASAGATTYWRLTNPAPIFGTSIPRNAILAPWHDIDPGSAYIVASSRIAYTTLGVAPNRRFILSYEDIPMYSAACETVAAQRFTSQIKIFETSNNVEIHVGNKQVCPTWNNGEAVMGLHGYDGTIYVPPVNATAHNAVGANNPGPYNQWTMTNMAYQFSSPCAVNGGPCAVLPINFTKFYGENVSNINKLTWETSEESDIKEFSIERSTDAVKFTQIGTQMPNNKASKYIYNDNTYKPNIINYYRITAIETNGQRKSTFIIPIGGVIDNLTVSELYPNPSSNKFSISFTSKNESIFVIKVKDIYGREVISSNHSVNAGVTEVSVNTNSLGSGVYIVEVVDAASKTLSQQKLIIAN